MQVSQKGVDLIKSFEGLRLTSYYDAVGIITIGYGHTGSDVKPNQTITKEEAEHLLKQDLVKFETAVTKLITIPLTQNQFDALVSFTYNCGSGALEQSTLRKRLNNKEDPNKVATEELPKWVNGSKGPLPGLVKRRNEELSLFCSFAEGSTVITIRSAKQTWFKKEPVQSSTLPNNQLAKVPQGRTYKDCKVIAKKDGHTQLELPSKMGTWWVYDNDWEGLSGRVVPVRNSTLNKDTFARVLLGVPYQSQRDNYRDSSRTCFSSACAMAAMFLKPGSVKNDDEYLKKVFALGDSTDSSVQVKVLTSLGLDPRFRQDGKVASIKARLLKGLPCPIGILHHGPYNAPSGGGHWICLIGFDDTEKTFIVHDPWGELDNASGTYISTNGKELRYSFDLIRKRWTVEGDGSGWWIDFG